MAGFHREGEGFKRVKSGPSIKSSGKAVSGKGFETARPLLFQRETCKYIIQLQFRVQESYTQPVGSLRVIAQLPVAGHNSFT